MITKQTTKRAAKILAEQKREYEKKFQSAKGDSKAIARAAAEYRSEYGKTPLKRWHNALSQAAKETSAHTAPVRKPAKPAAKPKSAAPDKTPKYRVPCYVILTHFWKSLPFEKQAPYVVCFNEYEVKDGKIIYKAVTTHPNGGKVVQQSIEERKLSDSLVANERIMISSFENVQREIAYNKYQKEIKAAEKKKHDAEVAKRKAVKAKPEKKQPKYKVPFYALAADKTPEGHKKLEAFYRLYYVSKVVNAGRTFNYYCWPVSQANLPKSRQVGERLTEEELTKDFTFPSDRVVQNIRTEHHIRVQKEAAEEAAAKQRQKEEDKAKYLTKNPQFQKQFAKDLGLPEAAIPVLYKICSTFKDEGKLRPVLCGIYCDPKGYVVATDAHILVAIKCNIPAKYKDNIYLVSGMKQDGRFPKWDQILPVDKPISDVTVRPFNWKTMKKLPAKNYVQDGYFDVTAFDKTKFDNGGIVIAKPFKFGAGLSIELAKKLDKLFSALKEKKVAVWGVTPEHVVIYKWQNITAGQMPMLINR